MELVAQRQHVGQRLARVVRVGEGVDDGHVRASAISLEQRLVEDAGDDGVAVAAEDARRVGHGSPRPSCSSSGRSMIGSMPEPVRGDLEATRGSGSMASRSSTPPCGPGGASSSRRTGGSDDGARGEHRRMFAAQVGDREQVVGAECVSVRFTMCVLRERVAQDRAGHAARAAASPAELGPGDGDDLDALLAERGVGVDVALVGDDDAGREGQDVVAVVPLLALGLEAVAAGRHDAQRGDAERLARGLEQDGRWRSTRTAAPSGASEAGERRPAARDRW